MDIKEKIKKAIEMQGADYEKLRDLYDMARLRGEKTERLATERMNEKNVYAFNPAFDK